jgi:rubrerythrin
MYLIGEKGAASPNANRCVNSGECILCFYGVNEEADKMKTREFNAISTILDSLLKEEQRGQRFFADAAKYSDSISVKTLFEKLAAAEREHIDLLKVEIHKLEQLKGSLKRDDLQRFRSMEYDDKEIPLIIIDPDADVEVDMPTLSLFKVEDFKKLFEDITLDKIYTLAMRVEFDNFKYLIDASKKMVSQDSRALLLRLAQEEKDHFIWIENHRKKIRS